MPDHALLLHAQKIIVYAVLKVSVPVAVLIQAVDETVIDVVGAKLLQLAVDGSFHGVEIKAPAVGDVGIIRTEMDLIKQVPSQVREGFAVDREAGAVPRGKIEIVDSAFDRPSQGSDRLVHTGVEHV